MTDTLELLRERGVLSSLDYHFARMLDRLVPYQGWNVLVGAALASRAISQGHVCVDLQQTIREPLRDADQKPIAEMQLPSYQSWIASLRQSPLVSAGDAPTPLVLDVAGRLYLHRYYHYQERLARNLCVRARRVAIHPDVAWLRKALARLLLQSQGTDSAAPDWQRLAALVAVERGISVISGGPGTGKTTTVVKILALLQEQAQVAQQPFLRILLLAPTGKAAVRLAESIQQNKGHLDSPDEVKEAIPETASTIHKALGYLPQTPTRFRHSADNPLPADVVVVDETSMVDMALMTKLVEAVPAQARLILLGDKDQLASVEAGAVLGDICGPDAHRGYSPQFAQRFAQITGETLPTDPTRKSTGIWDCMVHLTTSYRFGVDSGIGALARAVNAGQADVCLAYLRGERTESSTGRPYEDIALVSLGAESDPDELLGQAITAGFWDYLRARPPAAMLEQYNHFRVLCAHRRGRFGAANINRIVEERLRADGLIHPWHEWYAGRPILITQNDYQLRLFNGDVGVIATAPESNDQLKAFFVGFNGELRSFLPLQLPPHETVYAMTVHKSQSSEFDRVFLLLPEEVSSILTRELIYTGVTRARHHVTLYSAGEVLARAVSRRIQRASGLRDSLWTEMADGQ